MLQKPTIHKASGPDNLNARTLIECSKPITGILTALFDVSLHQGTVPDDWRRANVVPVFKQEERYNPANYGPMFITCICSKTLEHILVSYIMRHLTRQNILVYSQYGIRGQRSCETQLVQFVHGTNLNQDGSNNKNMNKLT